MRLYMRIRVYSNAPYLVLAGLLTQFDHFFEPQIQIRLRTWRCCAIQEHFLFRLLLLLIVHTNAALVLIKAEILLLGYEVIDAFLVECLREWAYSRFSFDLLDNGHLSARTTLCIQFFFFFL